MAIIAHEAPEKYTGMRRGLTLAAGVFYMYIERCGGKSAAEAVLCGIDRRSGSQGGRAAAAQIVKKTARRLYSQIVPKSG